MRSGRGLVFREGEWSLSGRKEDWGEAWAYGALIAFAFMGAVAICTAS